MKIKMSQIQKALRKKEIECMKNRDDAKATCIRNALYHLNEYQCITTINVGDYKINIKYHIISKFKKKSLHE